MSLNFCHKFAGRANIYTGAAAQPPRNIYMKKIYVKMLEGQERGNKKFTAAEQNVRRPRPVQHFIKAGDWIEIMEAPLPLKTQTIQI